MAAIWARVAAYRAGFTEVETYSGGTEITAFNPRAVAALRRAGFRVEGDPETGDIVTCDAAGDYGFLDVKHREDQPACFAWADIN